MPPKKKGEVLTGDYVSLVKGGIKMGFLKMLGTVVAGAAKAAASGPAAPIILSITAGKVAMDLLGGKDASKIVDAAENVADVAETIHRRGK